MIKLNLYPGIINNLVVVVKNLQVKGLSQALKQNKNILIQIEEYRFCSHLYTQYFMSH